VEVADVGMYLTTGMTFTGAIEVYLDGSRVDSLTLDDEEITRAVQAMKAVREA